MDPRYKEIYVKFFTKFKKNIQNPRKTAVTGRGGAGEARAHASQGKTKRRQPLTQKETEGATPLLHSWSTGAGPPLSFAHVHVALLGGGHAAGEQAAYAAPSREAVGNDGGDHKAEVIRLVLYRRLREDGRGGSNAIRWQKNG